MKYSLNGTWKFLVDENDIGKKSHYYSLSWLTENFDSLEDVEIPSNYNTIEGMDKYAGSVWFFIGLPEIPIQPKSYDYFIGFDGANYITEAWINDTYIGKHEGGFLPFKFRFSPRIFSPKFENFLAVRIDGSYFHDGVPSNNTDWFNWGGIHRNVYLEIIDKTRLSDITIKTSIESRNHKKAKIEIAYKIKNSNLYLEQCYIRQLAPEIQYEIYYLGRFFSGLQQTNQVLLDTGTQDVNPDSSDLEDVVHNKEAIEAYFQDALESISKRKAHEDLERFFESQDDNEDGDEKSGTNSNKNIDKRNNQNNEGKGQTINDTEFDYLEPDVKASFVVELDNPSLWSPDMPELYQLNIKLNGNEEPQKISFGIRQINIRKTAIFLNHQPIKLCGASLHEELIPYGRHYPIEERRKDILEMKNLGFNALRTAHYSHDESLIKIADEEGILVFEEIPLYWDCEFGNPKTFNVAASMVKNLIKRDINHPSVIAWSVGNEVPTERLDCRQTITSLMKLARFYDTTRIVTYVSNRYTSDTLRRKADICCNNAYFGWYIGSPYQLNFMLDVMYYTSQNKPWILTEFGAGALYGLRNAKMKFSEENQARIIAHSIKVLNSKPYIAGWFIWIYRDFRSHLRTNEFQQGYNRKGLVSDKNEKKLIARVMPDLVNAKLDKIRHYRGLAYMFTLLARVFERILFAFFFPIGYKAQRKMNAKYYTSKRIKNSQNTGT